MSTQNVDRMLDLISNEIKENYVLRKEVKEKYHEQATPSVLTMPYNVRGSYRSYAVLDFSLRSEFNLLQSENEKLKLELRCKEDVVPLPFRARQALLIFF